MRRRRKASTAMPSVQLQKCLTTKSGISLRLLQKSLTILSIIKHYFYLSHKWFQNCQTFLLLTLYRSIPQNIRIHSVLSTGFIQLQISFDN